MSSQQLSKESEKRILGALEKVSALTAEGTHPNDAIIKIASDERIPAGHVRLMVNAVNTGRTNAHRLNSGDVLEKAAEFSLADAATILEALYPNEVKTAAVAQLETVVSDEYRRSPTWLQEKAAQVKAARPMEWKLTDKKPVVERDPDYAIKKALGETQRLHQNLEQQRMGLSQYRNEAMKVAAALRTYFMQPNHIPFNEVVENCEILVGKSASAVLNIAKPTKEANAKRTSTEVNMAQEPYSLVKRAMQLSTEFKATQEAYTAAVKTANDESRRLLRPFGPGVEAGYSVLEGLSSHQPSTKHAGIGDMIRSGFGVMNAGNVAKEVAKRVPPQPSSDLERRDLQHLMDPAHESEIRNIQSEALLNDLLANDDVIKGYDPEEAIDAFNEVSQIAPHSTSTKVIMRDLMRKRLAGGPSALDQFTVGDTLGQQQKMRELNTPNENHIKGLQSIGVMPGGQKPQSVLG